MGALSNLSGRLYQAKWEEDLTAREKLVDSPEEEKQVLDIEVVAGEYGKSARIETAEGVRFYSLQKDCQDLPIGMKLKPSLCLICHLKRGVYQTTEKLLYLKED